MKENVLRDMIRKQIKSSLSEAPIARSAVGQKLGSVEKMAGVKMLKKALGQGTPAQQAAGLLQVVQAISGNNPATGKMLARMLMKGGIGAPEAPEAPVASENFAPVKEAEMSSALSSKMGRVDKTQAMTMLKKTLATKPATQQVDFVISMLSGLGLKDSAKKRLLLKMRQGLK
tara:strand:- start:1504 stop:2022 length:519 start_codon:yes stop_codon:yes gene_type:complete